MGLRHSQRISIGRYQVLERLGAHGPVGTWLCRRHEVTGLGRRVVVRTLESEAMANDEQVAAFEERGRLVARFDHPHIPRIEEVGRYAGVPFVVTEYVDGPDLHGILAAQTRQGSFDLRLACRIAADVARALDYAWHGGGEANPWRIAHAAVTPSNVLVSRKGSAKLLHFGPAAPGTIDIARCVRRGQLRSLAPETVMAQQVDHRSGLYSLGVLLYQLCVGEHPWSDGGMASRLGPPPRPSTRRADIGEELDELIAALLCSHPEGRPRRGLEVAETLEAWLVARGGPFTSAEGTRVLRGLFPNGGWRIDPDVDPLSVGRPAAATKVPWPSPLAVGLVAGLVSCVMVVVVGLSLPRPSADLQSEAFALLEEAELAVRSGNELAAQSALEALGTIPDLDRRLMARVDDLRAGLYLSSEVRVVRGLLEGNPAAALRRARELDDEFPADPWITSLVAEAKARRQPAEVAVPAHGVPLDITGTPRGAEVWLDGRPVGVVPFAAQVDPGPHRITLRHRGYSSRSRALHIEPRTAFHLMVDLPALPEGLGPTQSGR